MTLNEERALRIRLEELEEENRQLKDLLFPLTIFPQITQGISRTRLLATLYKHGGRYVNVKRLQVVSQIREAADSVPTHVTKLNKELACIGAKISNLRGIGYSLDIDSAFKLRPYAQELI